MFINSTTKKVFTKFVSLSLAIFLSLSPFSEIWAQEIFDDAGSEVSTNNISKNTSSDIESEDLPQVVGYDDEAEQNVDDLASSESELGEGMEVMSLSSSYDAAYRYLGQVSNSLKNVR